jgi:DNA modification methylase
VTEYYCDDALTLLRGDATETLAGLPDRSVDCCVTSPPYYGLRDYGVEGQLGMEPKPADFVARMVGVFREVRRVLADDGTLWLNLGDSYSAAPSGPHGKTSVFASSSTRRARESVAKGSPLPHKNLLGVPWLVAFALQADGWILRNAIVWHKPNAMPESVTDRLSTTYEHVFLLSKKPRYWFDLDVIRETSRDERTRTRVSTWAARKARGEPSRYGLGGMTSVGASDLASHSNGRNPGDLWSVSTTPFTGAHYAPMPLQLARRCVLAGCRPGGTVLDPFCGTGTSLLAANQTGRRGVGIDLNGDYLKLALERCQQAPLALDARRWTP